MAAYYNEFNPQAAAWLRELIKAGLIAPGEVDERSIADVKADDLRGFSQCHFFAGIGGWSYALRLAGWADDRPVWTGSPPCQPFSNAGRRRAHADARHLWPVFFGLIRECQPANIFGEQVEAAIRTGWLDDLQDDLEAENYATGKIILPACSVGAPHIRQRIWVVAERVGDTEHNGLPCIEKPGCSAETGNQCEKGAVVPSESEGTGSSLVSGTLHNWENPDWLYCRDSKWRPVESGTFPLANGIPERVGLLRGYGNAIVPQVAAEVIKAYMEDMPK
jgi:DNA (cytosine-5)-methyltransferase 1